MSQSLERAKELLDLIKATEDLTQKNAYADQLSNLLYHQDILNRLALLKICDEASSHLGGRERQKFNQRLTHIRTDRSRLNRASSKDQSLKAIAKLPSEKHGWAKHFSNFGEPPLKLLLQVLERVGDVAEAKQCFALALYARLQHCIDKGHFNLHPTIQAGDFKAAVALAGTQTDACVNELLDKVIDTSSPLPVLRSGCIKTLNSRLLEGTAKQGHAKRGIGQEPQPIGKRSFQPPRGARGAQQSSQNDGFDMEMPKAKRRKRINVPETETSFNVRAYHSSLAAVDIASSNAAVAVKLDRDADEWSISSKRPSPVAKDTGTNQTLPVNGICSSAVFELSRSTTTGFCSMTDFISSSSVGSIEAAR